MHRLVPLQVPHSSIPPQPSETGPQAVFALAQVFLVQAGAWGIEAEGQANTEDRGCPWLESAPSRPRWADGAFTHSDGLDSADPLSKSTNQVF